MLTSFTNFARYLLKSLGLIGQIIVPLETQSTQSPLESRSETTEYSASSKPDNGTAKERAPLAINNGKIAFLFLTIAEINHEQPWIDFLNGYGDYFSIYIHSKNNFNPQSTFKRYEIPAKIPTRWDLTMGAQIELLREALNDPQNQKFIFLSESTIPLQSFSTVYAEVMSHGKSIISYKPNTNRGRNRQWEKIREDRVYKNSQWIVLNRKHATMMVEDNKYIKYMSKSYDNEHYPSTFLNIKGLLDREVINSNTTFTIWPPKHSAHPITFTNMNIRTHFRELIEAIKNKMLFCRKFPKECDLAPLKPYIQY